MYFEMGTNWHCIQACTKASEFCGVGYVSLGKMIREKLFGKTLMSNKPILLKKVAVEKLSNFQIDLVRKVV